MGSSWKIPWPLICIDKEEQLAGVEITLPKLHSHYGTFHVRAAGTDRVGRKKYNNRVGKQTDLGDLEIHLWTSLLRKAIEQSGEKALYNHLLAWQKQHNFAKQSKEELEEQTMDLFAGRIFDNPDWVDFVPFNRKYRPEYLATVDMVIVVNTCCNKPYKIPSERLEHIRGKDSCCEHCGRHGPYRMMESEKQ